MRFIARFNAWNIAKVSCVVVLSLCSCVVVSAQGTLAYSFEDDDPLQGFAANSAIPGSSSVTQDTIGATNGTKSLKLSLPAAEGYAGALTGQLDPSIIGDPPGVASMTFDLTIPTAFPAEGFVDIFVVFFGIEQAPSQTVHEVSFQFDSTNRVAIGDLAPGTYPITMEFNEAAHPIDFENFELRPFNDIFGIQDSGPIDLIPVGFQITVNKSQTTPWDGYIDNIRFSSEPPVETPGDFDGDGDVDGRDFLVWQRGGTNPPRDPALLDEWQTNYGFGGLTAGFAAVPEPTCGLLAFMAASVGLACGRNR